MTKPKRIFIIGNNGAGKGVLAQAVAKQLGWKFINADVFGPTSQIGCSLTEAIGADGQAQFIKCLHKVLSHQVTQQNIVVTTDENIILSAENRQLLSDEFAVYVEVSPAIQAERLSTYRPLLPVDNFQELLGQAQATNNSYYEESASFSLNSDDGKIDDHVQLIINALDQ